VVVGSAVVKLIDEHIEGEQIEAVKRYIFSLHKACLDKKE
jgi:tryptophan synthase alpha subunit